MPYGAPMTNNSSPTSRRSESPSLAGTTRELRPQPRLERIGDADAALRPGMAVGEQIARREVDDDQVEPLRLEQLAQHPLGSLSRDQEDAGRAARLGERGHVAEDRA